MKKIFLKDIKEKGSVSDSFLVTKKETGVSKTGKAYLNLRLMDSTGEVEARVWDNAEALAKSFDLDDIVKVRAFGVSYQGRIQLNVADIYALKEDEYSLLDYLPASKRDPEEMIVALDAVIERMEDIHMRALLKSIFSDSEIRNRYKHAPAAKAMHHPYLGGLVEHVLSICSLVDVIAAHYTKEYATPVHKDLLMAGAILHDIGKIYELEYSRSFGYTDAGRLIGHITIGVEMVDAKIRQLDSFPDDLAMHLKHLLLSHHTLLEFGSPKRPKTLEAVLLGFLDDMDAKVNSVMSIMEATPEGEDWSPYQRMFERAIYTARPAVTREAAGGTPSAEVPSAGEAGEKAEAEAEPQSDQKPDSSFQSDQESDSLPQKEDLDLFS
jgi:3'-5' exoribonuclease